MSTLTTRASKGSELTHAEVDANWNALNTDKIEDVVSDLSPQLGGDLQVNGNDITSVSNGDVTITPNGTGDLVLDGLKWPQADGTANYVLETDGAGQLSWVVQSASGTTYTLDVTGGGGTYGVLAGLVNGSNALFTVSTGAYTTGTLKVWLNGVLVRQVAGGFAETTPGSGTFTMGVAPPTGNWLMAEYEDAS